MSPDSATLTPEGGAGQGCVLSTSPSAPAPGVPSPSRYAETLARHEATRRLSQDLHDRIAPSLASIKLRLEAAAGRLDRHPEARRLVQGAAAEAARVMNEIRHVIADLPPADLAADGLPAGLTQLVDRLQGSGTPIRLDVDGPRLHTIASPTGRAAYFIAAEALANALRHSAARQVTVRLAANPAILVLEVVDDGVGLPRDGHPTRGTGLASMTARAREAGGTCRILPSPGGSGTMVRAVLPLGP